MNTPTHLLIGGTVYRYIKGKRPDAKLKLLPFLWGNLSPDFTPGLLTDSHTAEVHLAGVQSRIAALTGEVETGDSGHMAKALGEICHFYSDFFCHAHCQGFTGGLLAHIRYEARLHRYARRRRKSLGTIEYLIGRRPGDVLTELEENRRFVLEQGQDFGLELYGAIGACCLILQSIVCEKGSAERENSVLYGHLSAPGERGDQHPRSA